MVPVAARLVLALALLAPPLGAEEPFATELSVGFGYEGSDTDRPLVVLDGTPSASYDYAADARAHAVDVSATRWLRPVPDDGRTPLGLLPYVARVSSLSARFALTGASRDSLGRFVGQQSSLEVSFSADGTLREADLGAEWFLSRTVALRAGLDSGTERETAASTSVESPSGRADVSTSGTRVSSTAGALGVAVRLGEHEVSLSGRYGEGELTRDDRSAFTGGADPFFSTLGTDSVVREATLAARLLLLDRRLVVDAAGRYGLATSSSDLSTALSGPWAQGRAIARALSAGATWYPSRVLGLTAGFAWATRDASSGPEGRLRPTSAETSRTFRAGVEWHASPRVAVAITGERIGTETVSPPGAATYQRFEETAGRVVLGARVRL